MPYLYNEAEKFIHEIFWTETYDANNKFDLSSVIGEKLLKDNKEKDPDYYNHRDGVVHVSSLSRCLRGVVLEMLGAKSDKIPDARKLGVFKAGNLFEEFIVNALADKMQDRQTEYVYKYKNIILTGRDDGTILTDGNRMVLEAKSVNSEAFWYRKKEGTLVAAHNQVQLQTYLWLRRVLFNDPVDGIFSYISKDDCTVIHASIKFNQRIIDEIVLPILDLINDAYTAKDPKLVPVPSLAVYSDAKNQWQKNWMCTYCDYHQQCVGMGWELECSNLVAQRNQEMKATASQFIHTLKKERPVITVVA